VQGNIVPTRLQEIAEGQQLNGGHIAEGSAKLGHFSFFFHAFRGMK
jgi:hypothetical protein